MRQAFITAVVLALGVLACERLEPADPGTAPPCPTERCDGAMPTPGSASPTGPTGPTGPSVTRLRVVRVVQARSTIVGLNRRSAEITETRRQKRRRAATEDRT